MQLVVTSRAKYYQIAFRAKEIQLPVTGSQAQTPVCGFDSWYPPETRTLILPVIGSLMRVQAEPVTFW